MNGCPSPRLRLPARRFRIAVKAMRRRGKNFSLVRLGLCLNAAISLFCFLVFSAPHRVHHFFEQTSIPRTHHFADEQTHDHSGGSEPSQHSPSPPASKASDCIVLSVAQSAHASVVASFSLPVFGDTDTWCPDPRAAVTAFRLSSPASPRAPPQL